MRAHIAAEAKQILLAFGLQDQETLTARPRVETGSPLPGPSTRRVSVHVIGLLLLASLLPLTSGAAIVSDMYGVPWGRREALVLVIAQTGAAALVFFWLALRVIARTPLDRGSPRQRLLQRGAAVTCGIAAMYTAATPLTPSRVALGPAVFGCVLAWLTLEVCRAHGVPLGTGLPATATQRLHEWRIAGSTLYACGFGGLCVTVLTLLVRWTGIDGVPVMQGDQLSTLGISRFTSLALTVVWAVAIEDIVLVAATTALLTAIHRPAWEIYTLVCALEVLFHAYMGLPAIGMAVYGIGRVWLYLRYRRLIPLMAGHGAFNLAFGPFLLLPFGYRIALVIPIATAWWINRRLHAAAARESPLPEPATPDTSVPGPGDRTSAPAA
ncbi:hypothetical protein ACFYXF_34905 [Streptomyces sp. NPDC002680]|uniref:hypothetical protein n=1 Tax=Streptomyces sp. NPDC002680 TaxID=3364659 RepID=UPI003681F7F5